MTRKRASFVSLTRSERGGVILPLNRSAVFSKCNMKVGKDKSVDFKDLLWDPTTELA